MINIEDEKGVSYMIQMIKIDFLKKTLPSFLSFQDRKRHFDFIKLREVDNNMTE